MGASHPSVPLGVSFGSALLWNASCRGDQLGQWAVEAGPVRVAWAGLKLTLSLQLQGAIMVASCVQMLVGFSGLIGFLMRFIGPLTIAPTISLVALPLFDSVGNEAGTHWGISIM